MPKRVYTGCRDCVKCMGTGVNVGARNLTRGLFAASSGGVTELGMAFMPKCRVCGHQKSLHRESFSDKMDHFTDERRVAGGALQADAKLGIVEAPQHRRTEQPKLTPKGEMSESELGAKLSAIQDALDAGMMNQSQYETMSGPFRERLELLKAVSDESSGTTSRAQRQSQDPLNLTDSPQIHKQSRDSIFAKAKEEVEHLKYLRDEGVLDQSEFVQQAKLVHGRYTKLANEID